MTNTQNTSGGEKMKFKDLKDGCDYIATDKDGKEYRGTYVNKYIPGGVFYCIYPMFAKDGTHNELTAFKEVTE